MAVKDAYYGSMGPFPYESTDLYADGKKFKGFRGRAKLEGDADDAPINIETTVAPTVPDDGDLWILTTGVFARVNGATIGPLIDATSVVTDHGALTGLADDDHTQYLLASGTRGLSGAWNAGAFLITSSVGFSGPLNGTVGATTPATGAFTTIVASGQVTLTAGPILFTPATQCRIQHQPVSGNDSTIHIEPLPVSNGLALLGVFRNTNTSSSTRLLRVYKGDGTSTIQTSFDAVNAVWNVASGGEYRVNGTKIGLTTGAIGGVLVTTPAAAHMLLYDSVDSRFENVAMSGDATISSAGALTLANSGVTPGTYTQVTVDAKGRATSGSTSAASGQAVVISTNATPVGNVGAGEDDLMSYTVLAAQLAANKDSLQFEALYFIKGGETTAIKIKFGATTVFSATGLGPAGDEYITIQGRIIRTGAATQIATFWGQCTSALAGFPTILQRTAPTETLSGTVVLKSTGESTATPANNDVQQLWNRIDYIKTV